MDTINMKEAETEMEFQPAAVLVPPATSLPPVTRCYFCNVESTTNHFQYYNNRKRSQPRYKCSSCLQSFTCGAPSNRPLGRTYKKKKGEDPVELKDLARQCPYCHVPNRARFTYYNNRNSTHPRFKCLGCREHFQMRLVEEPGQGRRLVHAQSRPRDKTPAEADGASSSTKVKRTRKGWQTLREETATQTHGIDGIGSSEQTGPYFEQQYCGDMAMQAPWQCDDTGTQAETAASLHYPDQAGMSIEDQCCDDFEMPSACIGEQELLDQAWNEGPCLGNETSDGESEETFSFLDQMRMITEDQWFEDMVMSSPDLVAEEPQDPAGCT